MLASKDDTLKWQPPSRLVDPRQVWGWADDIISDGEGWLQAQPFWNDLTRAENLIRGMEQKKADENRSDLTSNRLKKILREIVGVLSDVRHPDAWGSSNRAFAEEADMFSKVSKGIWYTARAPLSFRRMVQWMVCGGTGSLWPVYRRKKMVDPNSKGICFDAYGPRDIVPFMMPQDNDIQGCYACTIIRMVSIPTAHAMFPLFQDKLKPVSRRRQRSSVVNARMAFAESFRRQEKSTPWTDQLCEIRYTLVRDLSINNTDMPIPMGEPGASWSYVVPAIGSDIPSNEISGGERKMRKADIDDARLYPNMRLIITASGVNKPVYDGPAWDWHGMMPPRFFADDWVSESMGFSLIRDVLDIEQTRQFTERAVDMKVKAQMDPALIYDQSKVPSATAEEFDPWEMRARLGVEGETDEKVLRTAIPAELLKVGQDPFAWLEYLDNEQDESLGVNQFNALAKAKATVGAEDAGDLLKMAGPIVRDISASMESPMADVLEMVKYQILQFMSTAEVMNYTGPDGVTTSTFDFDPNSIVPSHMPGEDKEGASKFSRMERAKNFARNLQLRLAPGGLHGLPQTQQKLLLLQGHRAGLQIPQRLIFERVFGLENYEALRKEWREDKEWELEMAAKLKIEGASLLPGAGPTSPSGSPKGTGGRPPSGKKPPTAKTKGSAEGPRATITES
jgi:hypothetical protein